MAQTEMGTPVAGDTDHITDHTDLHRRFNEFYVNVTDYGAVADGTTDDSAAIQAAIDAVETAITDTYDLSQSPPTYTDGTAMYKAAGTVFFPAGIYSLDSKIQMNLRHLRLQGDGRWVTTIKAGSGFTPTTDPLLLMTWGGTAGLAGRNFVEDIRFDAAGVADHCLVVHRADRSLVRNCDFWSANSDGVHMDDNWAATAGGAHSMTFQHCDFNGNTGHGLYMKQRSNGKNNLQFLHCFATGNTKCGMVLKGQDIQVIGGNYQSNGDYGIQIGETADSGNTTGNVFLWPWFEANTGTIGGTPYGLYIEKGNRHIAFLGPQHQDVGTATGLDVDITVVTPTQQGWAFQRGSDLTTGRITFGDSAGVSVMSFTGDPESVEKAALGSIGMRDDGTGPTTHYFKTSGNQNSSTGWKSRGVDQTYTPTNVTTTRSFDADTVTVAALADVVGTIIADLQAIDMMK